MVETEKNVSKTNYCIFKQVDSKEIFLISVFKILNIVLKSILKIRFKIDFAEEKLGFQLYFEKIFAS